MGSNITKIIEAKKITLFLPPNYSMFLGINVLALGQSLGPKVSDICDFALLKLSLLPLKAELKASQTSYFVFSSS